MSNDTLARTGGDGLSVEELDAQIAEEVPPRLLMRRHRFFFRHVNRFNRMNHFNRFNHFNTFGSERFSRVSNFNTTSQSIFAPQVAVNIGGGHISQVGNNTNFNSNVQFGL